MFRIKRKRKNKALRAGILLSILVFLAAFFLTGCNVTTLEPDPEAEERVTGPDELVIREKPDETSPPGSAPDGKKDEGKTEEAPQEDTDSGKTDEAGPEDTDSGKADDPGEDLSGEKTPELAEPENLTEPQEEARDVFSTGTQFRNKDRFEEHYQKHVIDQQEFGDITREEYMALAQALVDSGGDGILSKVDEDKNTLYYDPETNSFAVVSKDGYLRTFFKPSQGRKYYDKQK